MFLFIFVPFFMFYFGVEKFTEFHSLSLMSINWFQDVGNLHLKPFPFTSKRKHKFLRIKLSQIPIFIAFYHFPFPSTFRILLDMSTKPWNEWEILSKDAVLLWIIILACNINCRRFSWIFWWSWFFLISNFNCLQMTKDREKCTFWYEICWKEWRSKLSVCQLSKIAR